MDTNSNKVPIIKIVLLIFAALGFIVVASAYSIAFFLYLMN